MTITDHTSPTSTAASTSGAGLLTSTLGFMRPETIAPDATRPGVLRAATIEPAPFDATTLDLQQVELADLASAPLLPTLDLNGFSRARIPERSGATAVLREILDAGALTPERTRALRQALRGTRLTLADGSRLLLLHVASEGVLMRTAGPDRIDLSTTGTSLDTEHGGAESVHADQDIAGTPLRQLMRGLAPRLLRHDAPDSSNRRSPLMLVNLWMPLHQPSRPLCLLDSASLDRPHDQLRYALPIGDVLGRKAEMEINDIWTFRHAPEQRWYIDSSLELGDAWVFDTTSTAHAAASLPGEALAADRLVRLDRAIAAVRAGTTPPAGLEDRELPPPLTRPLVDAVAALQDALATCPDHDASDRERDEWLAQAAEARDGVIRRSVEVRVLALRLPRL